MKNIISFSLFGKEPMYWCGALANIRLAEEIYPNYICRFYIDKESPKELINTIVGKNVEKVFMYNRGGWDGAFWRFIPATEKDVNIFLCRDTDSRLSWREKFAVDEWLSSDKNAHIMRDHPFHRNPMLAGMWGCRNQILNGFKQRILTWPVFQAKCDDQRFLATYIYDPIIKYSVFEHSEYNIKYHNNIHKFPSLRINNEFVGKKYYLNKGEKCEY